MARSRRKRTNEAKSDNPNPGGAQMALPGLAPSGQQDPPVQVLTSPNPSVDPQVHQESHQTNTSPPGSTAPSEDPLPVAGSCDRVPLPPGDLMKPPQSEVTCILRVPSGLDQQHACISRSPRRFTVESLLRLVEAVARLKGQPANEKADDHAPRGRGQSPTARSEASAEGNGGSVPADRAGAHQAHPRPDGDSELPRPQGDHAE